MGQPHWGRGERGAGRANTRHLAHKPSGIMSLSRLHSAARQRDRISKTEMYLVVCKKKKKYLKVMRTTIMHRSRADLEFTAEVNGTSGVKQLGLAGLVGLAG